MPRRARIAAEEPERDDLALEGGGPVFQPLHRDYATISPYRSWASLHVTRTCTRSPGLSPLDFLMCTTPSISGASALERPTAPFSPDSSIRTAMVLPIFCCNRRVLIIS